MSEHQKESKQGQPTRWTALDQPKVYAAAVAVALLTYSAIAFTSSTSLVNRAVLQTNKTLILISEEGLVSSWQEEPKAVSCLFLTCAMLAFGVVALWKATHREAGRAASARQFTPRLSLEQYELQKMETTRIELEKLTASAEFKRHQEAKKRQRAQQTVSRSLMDAYASNEDESENENNELRRQARSHRHHNQTVAEIGMG